MNGYGKRAALILSTLRGNALGATLAVSTKACGCSEVRAEAVDVLTRDYGDSKRAVKLAKAILAGAFGHE